MNTGHATAYFGVTMLHCSVTEYLDMMSFNEKISDNL